MHRSLPKLLYKLVTFLGDAYTAGVAVVNKYLCPTAIRVAGGGYTAVIVSVSHGEQWQYSNSGVFGSLQAAGKIQSFLYDIIND